MKFAYYHQKGDEAKSKGQYNLAEKWYIKGKELAEGDNKDPAASKHLAYNKLRNLYIATGQYDDAIAYGRKVLEEYQKQMTCNFYSSLRLIQLAVPHMKAQKWGRIVTIGSVQERKPHPDMLVYSASKAAQTNMAQSLAQQLAADGITVNNVAPGVIFTDRNVEALSDPTYAAEVTASIPAGFYGEPRDCAGVVRLLLSDAARYITGQSIYVDGGKSL